MIASAHITGIGWCAPESLGGLGRGARSDLPFGHAPLPVLRRDQVLDTPDKSFGRMDALCRLGLAACSMALRDAGLYGEGARETPQPAGAVLATGYGCLATDAAYWGTVPPLGEMASPHLFAYTLPSIMLGEAALRFSLAGPGLCLQLEPGQEAQQGLSAVTACLDFLAWGEAQTMLAGLVELGAPTALPGMAEACGQTARGALALVLEKSPPPEYSEAHSDKANTSYGLCALASGEGAELMLDNAPVGDVKTLLSRLDRFRRP